MPPKSPLLEEHSSAEETTPLTDQNIAILYQIIKFAEQYPDADALPFRAIFAAYESILPENGLDPDHDQVYLRFLFRLGDRREEGQSLYEGFIALLKDLGLQIEFVPDEEEGQGDAQSVDTEREGRPIHAQVRETKDRAIRSRRSSFNSVYDPQDGSTEQARLRPGSRASMSRLDVSQRSVLEARPSTRATTRKTEKTPVHVAPQNLPALQARRDRLTAEEFANRFQAPQQRRQPLSRQPSQKKQNPAALREPVPNYPSNSHVSLGYNPPTDDDDGENRGIEVPVLARPIQSRYALSQHERLYNPSRTQLFRDAETFHHFRIRSVARDIIDRWCYAAIQAKDQHQHLERLAAAHDTEILLRQAFEHWRLRLHAKKQAVATERYFKHEEKRIAKARDLMLLSKAFTHWAQCASDERVRMIDARHKLLSLKYFRAWRGITLANHLHIRHQGLRKFFGIWKRRYVSSLTNDVRADLVRHESVARNAYWLWFWAFCERRAPEWRAGRLRRKCLLQWIAAFKDYSRQEQHIRIQAQNTTRRQALSKWLQKVKVIASNRRQAAMFNRHNEALHALQCWKRISTYAPLYQQVSNMVDWRVAGATFAIFVARYRYERQAEAVNRLRIIRNSWTQWNDCLRWQTVAHRIDDRFCLEALYKWVISERYILLRRLCVERLKYRFMHRLKSEFAVRQMHRTHSCQLVEDGLRKATLRHYLGRLRSQLDKFQQDFQIAFEFHAPKLVQDAMEPWTQSLKNVQRLEDLAKDTRFYYVMRRHLKRWHAASLESKKQKRKNAYVRIRRKQKMKLAGSALHLWHYASARMQNIKQQADLAGQQRLLKIGTQLFDHWRSQFTFRTAQDYQASQHHERRLLERYFYTWVEGLESQANREELAEVNYDMRIKNVAFSWFNKLRLKIIEQKGQEANAENLRSWYEKRHFRNLLRQWHGRTVKQLHPQEDMAFSSRITRTNPRAIAVDNEATNRAEDWTDFDIEEWIPALEAQSSTTPLPGYLSTPSKRAARAKALVKASTTPVGTPFERRLRSQISSTPRTARRSGLGRSTAALRGSTFSAILEDPPQTPERSRERQ